MNTPESDMEQMKFAREWVRAHAAKKMAKYEKKLRRAAKDFFGHPVAIAYLKPGAVLEIPTMISYRRPGAGVKAKEKIVTPEGEVVCADKVSSESAEGFGYISHFATCKARNR